MICFVLMQLMFIFRHAELRELTYELEDVTDWYWLGILLRLQPARLQYIEQRYSSEPHRCKMEMLTCWLRSETSPSWLLVAGAVKRMGFNRLAEDITRRRVEPSPGNILQPIMYCFLYV